MHRVRVVTRSPGFDLFRECLGISPHGDSPPSHLYAHKRI
jgi:hypothetical protein